MYSRTLITFCLVLIAGTLSAQKYTAEKSLISFYSDAPLEDITAENKKATTLFNAATGDLVFSVTIKEFKFEKSLMQEHFNEKYMESEKFPKATFQGKVEGFDLQKQGVQEVKSKGKLTIHGVTKEIEVPGTMEVANNKIMLKSKFMVKVADHNITIPQLVFQNIAESVEVTVDFTYKPQ